MKLVQGDVLLFGVRRVGKVVDISNLCCVVSGNVATRIGFYSSGVFEKIHSNS